MFIAIKLLSNTVLKSRCQYYYQTVEQLEENQISLQCQPTPIALKAKGPNDAS